MALIHKTILNIACLLIACSCLYATPSISFQYHVEFYGSHDTNLLALLNSASKLVALENSPPTTAAALNRRLEEDIPNLLKALQSMAYYHAKVDTVVDATQSPILIKLTVETGPIYPFAAFKIQTLNEATADCVFPLQSIRPQDLGIIIGAPALPEKIIEAEERLTTLLAKEGYPLAKLIHRDVLADQTEKSISVVFQIDIGPQATFGTTYITGDKEILPAFFSRKIAWREGQKYNPSALVRTANALEASGLFSSINISHDETIQLDGSLPMQIAVKEAKHRSVAFGVGYATDLGFGVNGEWEHRNMRGMGEKLRCVANIWQIKQEGYVRYIMPDFCSSRQDLIWQAELEHEVTKGFRESAINLSGTIERQLDDQTRISYGGMFTILRNSHSNNNRDFNIFSVPFQLLWYRTNSLLDPTEGIGIHFKTTPALQTLDHPFAYVTHLLTTSAYYPLDACKRFVLAAKGTIGSIWGASDQRIPPSERLYAGSDTLLRGYRYLTVSPLGPHHKPIGGRSMMVFSLEARMRIVDPFGLVAFYDVGNVYKPSIPQFVHQQLQSVGLGLRYHTPVGPLRLDIALPLNRRPHLDPSFQVYFSIGQAF